MDFSVSFMYTWVFTALFMGIKASPPPKCVFPFLFEGQYYPSCTTDGSGNDMPWCGLTENYDVNRQWKQCSVTEEGGNSGGKPCVFPFIYMSRTYYTCTDRAESKGRFWCATTGSYDKDKKWSYCADTRLDANYPKEPCNFPFIFDNKLYSACTTDGRYDGRLWCSVSRNFDNDPRWTYCEPSDPAPCNFPFIYRNKSYYSCTKDGSLDGQLWCATTPNYDKDSKWKSCSLQEYGGNSNGEPCVFPFKYNGESYSTCIQDEEKNNEKNGRFWCATTEVYDEDQKWSFCADIRLKKEKEENPESKGPCVFPFTYKKKVYTACTTDGTIGWKLWCSLTNNYDNDRKWRYCEPSDLPSEDPWKH